MERTRAGRFIVQKMIDKAGGKTEVEIEAGKGSAFKVYLKK